MDTFAWKHKPTNTYLCVQSNGNKVLSRNVGDLFTFSEENQGLAFLARNLDSVKAKFSDFDLVEIKLP